MSRLKIQPDFDAKKVMKELINVVAELTGEGSPIKKRRKKYILSR